MDLDFIRQAYEDKCLEIDTRKYVFTAATHHQRKRVFAFLSKIAPALQTGDLSFIATPECAEVEKVIGDMVTVDGLQLSKRATHWDDYPDDYLIFLPLAMMVISYPFLRGSRGGLLSLSGNKATAA